MVDLSFTKMHGTGNDFVIFSYLDGLSIPEGQIVDFSRFICDRHFGVGADGAIFLLPSKVADFLMRIFNPDGSEAEMCGNGIRCAAKWLHDHGYVKSETLKIETLAGIKIVWVQTQNEKAVSVTVDMGEPIFEPSKIPTTLGDNETALNIPLSLEGIGEFSANAVSMGNPHCVIFVDNVDTIPLENLGAKLECHPAFPNRTNVEFAQVLSQTELKIKVWERGAGATLSCGSGACATVAVAAQTKRSLRKTLVHLPGGDLEIDWRDDGHIYMTGSAVEVFHGKLSLKGD